MTRLLLRSIHERVSVEMIYLSSKGEITQRLIKPYSFDGRHIKAYCSVRKGIRTFDLNNILSVVIHV